MDDTPLNPRDNARGKRRAPASPRETVVAFLVLALLVGVAVALVVSAGHYDPAIYRPPEALRGGTP